MEKSPNNDESLEVLVGRIVKVISRLQDTVKDLQERVARLEKANEVRLQRD